MSKVCKLFFIVLFCFPLQESFAQKAVYSTSSKKAIKLYEQAVEQLNVERKLDASLVSLSKALEADPEVY